MTCERCQLSLRTCRELHTLNIDKEGVVRKIRQNLMPVINENDAFDSRRSRANIGVSQINIPLAWNSDQHFKSKGETRIYSMFVVLQTKMRVLDSHMVTNVDRTMTDVMFPETFIFEAEPDDFCVEITIYGARIDLGLSNGGGSLRSRITRSLGRKFGGQVKANLNSLDFQNSIRGNSFCMAGTHFNILARACLVLNDAGEEGKIHDLQISPFADLCGPPLYGHILCRLVVQPLSVLRPLAEGTLSIRQLCEERMLKNVRTRLQAGNLHCFSSQDRQSTEETTLLLIPITSASQISNTSNPNTILLSSLKSMKSDDYRYYISTEDYRITQNWKRAIEMQIDDCAIWGEFAYRPTKLVIEKPVDPVKETLSRAAGARLYDKISIAGTISCDRDLLNYTPSCCINDGNYLAGPPKKTKHRPNVLDLFQSKPSSPTPSRRGRSPNGAIHRCIIELDSDDGYGRIKSESPSTSLVRTSTSRSIFYDHCPHCECDGSHKEESRKNLPK
ncbi:unnamed protein product [Cylicocyclus nassatus]|uniref:Anillin homology domain-containing protein n=1 Tax=Cylicocyclus nassatus TaxID=53992 RepID=A0AA36HE06_CYLNA|nr:unnamed protein product [Cylicocyclus nassatus]